MSILSIQSHVAYGYVGNKAAVFPLQSMGYDVWPVNTVQFSNHTGYGKWTGELFTVQHVNDVVSGIEQLGVAEQCQAILSGYLGSGLIGNSILDIVGRFKKYNPNLIYLCDPVVGDIGRGVFVKSEVLEFFKSHLHADIITPNHFEAEILSGKTITNLSDAKQVANYFHQRNVKIVIITSLRIEEAAADKIHVFLSHNGNSYLAEAPLYHFPIAPNGTGDLFSSLFLGSYLQLHDNAKALEQSLGLMDTVMAETFKHNSRELKVVNVDYRHLPIEKRVTVKSV
jgi:pyridoxine kinase